MHDEVADLIQRDLDGDLSDEEKSLLLALVQQNPEFQLKYGRMQKVNSDLAALPPVAPPFSIVDSILPNLNEELDANIAAPVTSAAIPVLERKKQVATPVRRGVLPIWLTKVGSVTAAACLLLGLFAVANNLPQATTGRGGEAVTDPTQVPKPKPLADPAKSAQPLPIVESGQKNVRTATTNQNVSATEKSTENKTTTPFAKDDSSRAKTGKADAAVDRTKQGDNKRETAPNRTTTSSATVQDRSPQTGSKSTSVSSKENQEDKKMDKQHEKDEKGNKDDKDDDNDDDEAEKNKGKDKKNDNRNNQQSGFIQIDLSIH